MSAGQNLGNTVGGLTAGEDLSAKQFHAVKADPAVDNSVIACGAGEAALGVLMNNPEAGEEATVWTAGATVRMPASAAVTRGGAVSCAAAGDARNATSGDYILGQALVGAAAAPDFIKVTLTLSGRLA